MSAPNFDRNDFAAFCEEVLDLSPPLTAAQLDMAKRLAEGGNVLPVNAPGRMEVWEAMAAYRAALEDETWPA